MKNRKDFVLAVIVAFGVPLLLGSVYFCDMYSKRGANNHIARLEEFRELLVFGDKDIRNMKGLVLSEDDYESAEHIEFSVDYSSGPEKCTQYGVYLNVSRRSTKTDYENVAWRLIKFDKERGDYVSVMAGNLENERGLVKLADGERLCLTEEAKYKLYYYLKEDTQVDGLVARLSIE